MDIMRARAIPIFALAAVLALLLTAPGPLVRAAEPSATMPTTGNTLRKAVVITIDGQIDDYSKGVLLRRFEKARSLNADTVILQIDTYGGLVTSALEMSRFLKRQDNLHIIAFVHDKAISAGAMIALACDEIVMSPGATIGDAAPISISPSGRLEGLGPAERAKIESPLLADFYESAIENGHNPLLAEAMVAVGRVVYWIEGVDGSRRFVDEQEYAGLKDAGWKPVAGVPNPVDRADTLLTVHTDLAMKIGLARGIADDAHALAAARGCQVVADLSPGGGDRFVSLLSSNVARTVLLVVFLLSLYIGLHAPGHGAAEAVALVSLGLLVGVPMLTGYAQWWEILAIFVGLALLALEIFVIPGFGVTGMAGIVLLLGGLIMTFVGNAPGLPGLWKLPAVREGVQSGVTVVIVGLVSTVLLATLLRRFLPKMPMFNRLILATPTGDTVTVAPGTDPNDVWPFAGTIGVAVTPLKPGGSAEFPYADDRRTTAVVSDSGYIDAGTKVAVLAARGNRVVVRPVGRA
jgi:membrane-bound serine protease (ClpP class)